VEHLQIHSQIFQVVAAEELAQLGVTQALVKADKAVPEHLTPSLVLQ
jgi:hypothetical protein